jgi:voltage-gated potassium channel
MTEKKIIRRIITALALLLTTITIGVTGFHLIEGLGFVDALYMTFITVSTVGFETAGDHGFTQNGKIFVVALIIFAIGTFTYAITTLTTLLLEGEIRDLLKGYRVNKEINKLSNHVIICGLGRNGRQSAVELIDENVPWVAIEHNEEVIAKFLDQFPKALVLRGDATSEELLQKANLSSARGVISALADDAANVFVTLTIRQMNPTVHLVARASNESTIKKLEIAGANRVILPNVLGGRKMAKLITRPALMDFVDLITGQGQSHLRLEEIHCGDYPGLQGKTLRDLDIRSRTGVLVLGMQDKAGRFELNPNVNKAVQSEESLFIIGEEKQITAFMQEFQ